KRRTVASWVVCMVPSCAPWARLMLAAGIGIAPIPSVLQTDVQTAYTIQRVELVLPRGNAPRSLAYQASALLLSYRRGKGLPADALQAEGTLPQSRKATRGI